MKLKARGDVLVVFIVVRGFLNRALNPIRGGLLIDKTAAAYQSLGLVMYIVLRLAQLGKSPTYTRSTTSHCEATRNLFQRHREILLRDAN